MATIWKIDIEKNMAGEYWTNVYHALVTDTSAAQSVANAIVAVERACHGTQVNFDKYRVQNTNPLGQQGTITNINLQGLVTKTGPLPLFCVARVDISVAVGRPSRKYLRLPIVPSEISSGVFTSAFLTSLGTQYLTPIVGVANICDESGQSFLNAVCAAALGMRQLRRGSKRRVLP